MSSNGMSVGETIAAARVARGLSVDDLSQKTRIRPVLIKSIEFDDFTPCGGDAYARGHIRTIATTLGLDADVLLDQFSVQGGKPAKVRSKVEPIEQPTRIMQSANRSDGLRQLAGQLGMQDVRNGGTLLPLIVGIVVLLIVIGLFYFFTHRG